jgi:hypothetical protein
LSELEEITRMQEQIITLFKNEEKMDRYVDRIQKDVEELKRYFANRLPIWATMLIGILMATCGWFAGR